MTSFTTLSTSATVCTEPCGSTASATRYAASTLAALDHEVPTVNVGLGRAANLARFSDHRPSVPTLATPSRCRSPAVAAVADTASGVENATVVDFAVRATARSWAANELGAIANAYFEFRAAFASCASGTTSTFTSMPSCANAARTRGSRNTGLRSAVTTPRTTGRAVTSWTALVTGRRDDGHQEQRHCDADRPSHTCRVRPAGVSPVLGLPRAPARALRGDALRGRVVGLSQCSCGARRPPAAPEGSCTRRSAVRQCSWSAASVSSGAPARSATSATTF